MFTQFRLTRALCFAGAILAVGSGAVGLTSTASFAANVGPGSTVNVGNAPYSTASKSCDPNRDGYHFIVNQLVYPVGAVINGSDFGPINITFSDGSTAVATFTDLSGQFTAHFLNNTIKQTGNYTITSATLTFPAGTDITGYGSFVISHPPCATVTTTTTTTVTPTTVTPTTVTPTTVTPTTVTPTTVTPTTLVLSEGPVPTTGPATPTTLVLSGGPVQSTPADVGPSSGQLPSTGSGSSPVALLGVALFGIGLTGMALARKSRPVSN